jgi:tol-pal system protein YbgF
MRRALHILMLAALGAGCAGRDAQLQAQLDHMASDLAALRFKQEELERSLARMRDDVALVRGRPAAPLSATEGPAPSRSRPPAVPELPVVQLGPAPAPEDDGGAMGDEADDEIVIEAGDGEEPEEPGMGSASEAPAARAAAKPGAPLTGKALYEAAVESLRGGEPDEAERMLRAFLAARPDPSLRDNAIYWIGECYMERGDYRLAIGQFAELGARHPDSNKLADALYRTSLAHRALGDAASARAYAQRVLDEHPDSEAARSAREDLKRP